MSEKTGHDAAQKKEKADKAAHDSVKAAVEKAAAEHKAFADKSREGK